MSLAIHRMILCNRQCPLSNGNIFYSASIGRRAGFGRYIRYIVFGRYIRYIVFGRYIRYINYSVIQSFSFILSILNPG